MSAFFIQEMMTFVTQQKKGFGCKITLSLETEWQHTGAHARLATQNLTHTQIKEKK